MIRIIEDFVSPQEEMEIMKLVKQTNVPIGTNRNTITRYGSALPYKSRIKSPIIPPILISLCKRMYSQHLTTDECDSVTINEYLPTQSIDWHVDSPTSGPIIVVLSLLSPAGMGLRYKQFSQIIDLPPRSLLLLSGDERTKWEHCIYPVERRRYSVVFRKGTKI